MEDLNTSENFLAKWVEGTLTNEERMVFERSKDYQYYQAILDGTEALEIPVIDKDAFYVKLKKKMNQKRNSKVISLFPRWAYATAASILLIIGYTLFFTGTESYSTGYGEQLIITLPDNSEVTLNAKSKLEYISADWKQGNRIVNLKGEGFFKVEKGSDFIVQFKKGTVSVLGTEFTVNTNDNTTEVLCYEGKVRANINEMSRVISKGEAVRYMNNTFEHFSLSETAPNWMVNNESKFYNAPIINVIKALENQYNIRINSESIDKTLRFTGSFTNKNKDVALNTVFDTMEIKFTFTDKNTVYLSSEK